MATPHAPITQPAFITKTGKPRNEHRLTAPPAGTGRPAFQPEIKPGDAERRHMTVVFCDLSNSTQISAQLDAEEYSEVVKAYQRISNEVIQRFEGYIGQYLGDGLLIYFGFPQAHEDDAKRAIHAGLGIIEAMKELNNDLEPEKGIRLSVRVGIHTGVAIVGEIGCGDRQEHLAIGETPNIAARLEGLASSNTVVISETTARLVQGAFELEDLGAHHLKGIEKPMSVIQVLKAVDPSLEEDEVKRERSLPLVGRDEEVGLLLRRWTQSKEGIGQVVLITGEAGIGKTRLVEKMRNQVIREGFTRIQFLCSPYHTNSTLYPVIAHLQRFLQIQPEDLPSVKLNKLESALANYSLSKMEVVPLFAELLSIPLQQRYSSPELMPQKIKQRTLDALVVWLLEEAEKKPLLTVWEDIQLADPSTMDLLGLVIEQAPTAPILNLLTFRPELVPPWPSRSHMTTITLHRLGRPEREDMITNLAGGKAMPVEAIDHIIAKTDGVPLFVEELTKMLLESGFLYEGIDQYKLIGSLSDVAIPHTLQDSLMARLDRHPTVRDVAQLGAVFGREFAYEMLQAIANVEDRTLQRGLAKLVETEMLYQRGRAPRSKYVFKHAMVRDAAYDSLLKNTRQQYHQQIAKMFETRFPETLDMQPELVAQHYTEGGQSEKAVPYWQQAGKLAAGRSANIEAVHHLKKGLEVLKEIPETKERTLQELQLLTILGPVLMATKGYAAPETESVYVRARQLCKDAGEAPQLFPVLAGLWRFYLLRAEYHFAQDFAEQLLSLAKRTEKRAFLIEASRALGSSLFYRGELVSARIYLEEGMVLYDAYEHSDLALQYGQDSGVACRSYASWVLWLLGYPDQALKLSSEAVAFAEELGHPFSLALALSFSAWFHQFCQQPQLTYERAESARALSVDMGFQFWLGWEMVMQGWAMGGQDSEKKKISMVRQGIETWRATGSELGRPYFLALFADVCSRAGQVEKGLRLISEALNLVSNTKERWYEAELYRLKGEMLFTSCTKNIDEVETCFFNALKIAQHQKAKSLELRAAICLARLWHHDGKAEQARQLLGETYDWFTEGFDTPDLQEAKKLLEELDIFLMEPIK